MKRATILAITILLAGATFADRSTLKDRTDNWLQSENTEATTSGNLRLDAPGTTGKNENNQTGAVGDSLWLLAGLSIAYGFFTIRKKTILP